MGQENGAKVFPHQVNAAVQFACKVINALTQDSGAKTGEGTEEDAKVAASGWNEIKEAITTAWEETKKDRKGEQPNEHREGE